MSCCLTSSRPGPAAGAATPPKTSRLRSGRSRPPTALGSASRSAGDAERALEPSPPLPKCRSDPKSVASAASSATVWVRRTRRVKKCRGMPFAETPERSAPSSDRSFIAQRPGLSRSCREVSRWDLSCRGVSLKCRVMGLNVAESPAMSRMCRRVSRITLECRGGSVECRGVSRSGHAKSPPRQMIGTLRHLHRRRPAGVDCATVLVAARRRG